jgi:hypothetical protein
MGVLSGGWRQTARTTTLWPANVLRRLKGGTAARASSDSRTSGQSLAAGNGMSARNIDGARYDETRPTVLGTNRRQGGDRQSIGSATENMIRLARRNRQIIPIDEI